MTKKLIKYEVGEPFPGPVPPREGAIMELWVNGLNVIIQMPDLTRVERQAFKKSFKRYGSLETAGDVPVGVTLHGPWRLWRVRIS